MEAGHSHIDGEYPAGFGATTPFPPRDGGDDHGADKPVSDPSTEHLKKSGVSHRDGWISEVPAL